MIARGERFLSSLGFPLPKREASGAPAVREGVVFPVQILLIDDVKSPLTSGRSRWAGGLRIILGV
jgi:hypothetical protein